MAHQSVLLQESIEILNLQSNDLVVDATLGAGGHSREILKKIPQGTLIAFDSDSTAITNFQKYLLESGYEEIKKGSWQKEGQKVILVNQNFAELQKVLEDLGVKKINKVLADLGWSSDQLETLPGLSYLNPKAELDMRLDQSLGVKAKDLLNALGKKELEKMFSEYADLTFLEFNNLSRAIVESRKVKLIETVEDLLAVINKSVRGANPSLYSRVFQALRIAVNSELINLQNFMKDTFQVLRQNGVFLIISFHSGEEKLIKKFIKEKVESGEAQIVTSQMDKDYVRPGVVEISQNIRSRSAKLHGVKKTK